MNARVKPTPAVRVAQADALKARAEARAILLAEDEIDLHSAVDELWTAAVRDGLVKKLGVDAVQRILADAFAPARDELVFVDLPADPVDLPANLPDDVPDADAAPETGIELPDDDEYQGLSPSFAKACRQADERVRARREQQRERPQKKPHAAQSTLQAAEYLIQQRDAKRLRAWLVQHTPQERAAILEHLEQKVRRKCPSR